MAATGWTFAASGQAPAATNDAINPPPEAPPTRLDRSAAAHNELIRVRGEGREQSVRSARGLPDLPTSFLTDTGSPPSLSLPQHTPQVSEDGLAASWIDPNPVEAHLEWVALARSANPAPTRVPLFYFEATVVGGLEPGPRPRGSSSGVCARCVDIGFIPASSAGDPPDATDVWPAHSFALHGSRNAAPGEARPTASAMQAQCGPPPTRPGDTVGAGIDWSSRTAFFTRNGGVVVEAAVPLVLHKKHVTLFYPTIRLQCSASVALNFGATPFAYDPSRRAAAAAAAFDVGVEMATAGTGGGDGDASDGANATAASLVREFLSFTGSATSLAFFNATCPPPSPPAPESADPKPSSLAARAAARACLAAGDVAGAAAAALAAPGVPSPAAVLASPPAALFLACQATLERLRVGDLAGAVEVGRAALAPFLSRSTRFRSVHAGRGRWRAAVASANGLAPFLGLPSPLAGLEDVAPPPDHSSWCDDEWTDHEVENDLSSDDEDPSGLIEEANEAAVAADRAATGAAASMAADVLALAAYDLSGLTGAGRPQAAAAAPLDSVAAAAPAPLPAGPPPRLAALLSRAQRDAAADALNAAVLAAIADGPAAGFAPQRLANGELAPTRQAWPASRLEGALRAAGVLAAAERGGVGPPFSLTPLLPPRPPGGQEAGWEPIIPSPPPVATATEDEATSVLGGAARSGPPPRKAKRKAGGG